MEEDERPFLNNTHDVYKWDLRDVTLFKFSNVTPMFNAAGVGKTQVRNFLKKSEGWG